MQEYQDELADSLENRGWDRTVVQSFLVVAPLLLEHEAISRNPGSELVPGEGKVSLPRQSGVD